MHRSILGVYHTLPSWLRNLAATARGHHLDSLRYGTARELESRVAAAVEREFWPSTQWENWRERELTKLLDHARTNVPYYAEVWKTRGIGWKNLSQWPFLEKSALRAVPDSFVASGRRKGSMIQENTSGTTGTPLRLCFDRGAVRSWYALYEARARRWYGVKRGDSWGMLGGQQIVPQSQAEPPFWVWNASMNQLYLSAYHMAPRFLAHYVWALRRYRVVHLLGYTSALVTLAQFILESNELMEDIRVVVTNAEPLFEHQRAVITRAFGCPVRETYGMSEIVTSASECEAGRLHLWPEVGVTEVFRDGEAVASGEEGDLVCTGLLNPGMPLIRYRVGDRGALSKQESVCPCGRKLPLLDRIDGRCDDVLMTSDGRQVGRLDPVFKGGLPLKEAQIIQETLHRVRLVCVPADGFKPQHARILTDRLRDRLGDLEVVVETVPEIPRSANGKFKAVVSRLSRVAGDQMGSSPPQ